MIRGMCEQCEAYSRRIIFFSVIRVEKRALQLTNFNLVMVSANCVLSTINNLLHKFYSFLGDKE